MIDSGDSVPTPAPKLSESKVAEKTATACRIIGKALSNMLIYIGIIAGAVVAGYRVGLYVEDATILKDCQEVGTAKVGERFIKCDIVPKKKDPETVPPR